jgi:hypothetical protein
MFPRGTSTVSLYTATGNAGRDAVGVLANCAVSRLNHVDVDTTGSGTVTTPPARINDMSPLTSREKMRYNRVNDGVGIVMAKCANFDVLLFCFLADCFPMPRLVHFSTLRCLLPSLPGLFPCYYTILLPCRQPPCRLPPFHSPCLLSACQVASLPVCLLSDVTATQLSCFSASP